jgi:hypothetical protein
MGMTVAAEQNKQSDNESAVYFSAEDAGGIGCRLSSV